MSQIKQDSIDELKNIIDIVDLISSFIEVKKSGSSFVAVCPFHDDKNPSMSISLQKGLYHCHACGAGGDSIKFVMDYEKLGFAEAIELIAKFFNYSLAYDNNYTKQAKSDLLALVANFYHQNLFKNDEVIRYLKQRGLDAQSVKDFKIGYCGASFETIKFIDDSSLSFKEATEYGLIIKNADKYYARFANRIIFPIFSPNSVVVGFGGRTLSEDKNIAKYINSTQSAVFNKSKILYGFNIARSHIHKQESIIITEGYLDTILLHKNGFRNAVATLGTAFNDGHLSLLKKEDYKIFMCFDGDQAGSNAALKASKLLAQNSKDGGVIMLNNGIDPADMMLKNQSEEFEKLCKNNISFVDFILQEIIKKYDLKNPIQKQNSLKEIVEFLNTLTPLLQRSYIEKISSLLNIDKDLIKVKSNKKNISVEFKPKAKDIAETRIIASMMGSDECFFEALNYLKKDYFESYSEEFNLISKNETDNHAINEFRFYNSEPPLNMQDLREQIRFILIKHCKKILKNITNSNLESIEKLKIIKKMKQNLQILESGKLISL